MIDCLAWLKQLKQLLKLTETETISIIEHKIKNGSLALTGPFVVIDWLMILLYPYHTILNLNYTTIYNYTQSAVVALLKNNCVDLDCIMSQKRSIVGRISEKQ
jgi:hypothetical protein